MDRTFPVRLLLVALVGAAVVPVLGPTATAHARAISIDDATIVEGDSGEKRIRFDLTLSHPHSRRVVVHFRTVERSANEGRDFIGKTGKIGFKAGETTERLPVRVLGDKLDERDETFRVRLFRARRAEIEDRRGKGTIEDDDVPPKVTIIDDSTLEGGSTTMPVRLSRRSGRGVRVEYEASDVTATGGFDYTPESGELVFRAGDRQHVVTIETIEDDLDETDETFDISITNTVHASINDGQATGTIIDDD